MANNVNEAKDLEQWTVDECSVWGSDNLSEEVGRNFKGISF